MDNLTITGKKILIVEDEKALINALNDKFTRAGYVVLVAQNGQEGFDLALSDRPDLILLDIIMPVMDGMTFLRKLRRDSWGKGVKVILLTNLSDPGKEEECRKHGVHHYLIKSNWKIEDIVKKVAQELK